MTDDRPMPPHERLTAAEAETVRRLAQLSGLSIWQIMRAIRRSPRHAALFTVAVDLAMGEWDWLDGVTGQWGPDPDRQHAKLLRYLDLLIEDEPCNGPSRLN